MASILIEEQIEIPAESLGSLADFRRWATGESFPETGRIDYIAGRIEVDRSPENLYQHGKLKTEMVITLGPHIRDNNLGDLFTDSTRISSDAGQVSAEPDIVFVSNATLDAGTVRLVLSATRRRSDFIELEGAPDMVLEIVSDSSVRKDKERLPRALFEAGVREYWLCDARSDDLIFKIHVRGSKSFEPAKVDPDGAQYSGVFERGFRLERHLTSHERWQYKLHITQ